MKPRFLASVCRGVPAGYSQIFTVSSLEDEANFEPSRDQLTDQSQSSCAGMVISSAPDAASQTLMVPSKDPEASFVRSGDRRTESTESVWPSRVLSSSPVIGSQIRTVLSRADEAILSTPLSDHQMTDSTSRVCPNNGRITEPLARSQIARV